MNPEMKPEFWRSFVTLFPCFVWVIWTTLCELWSGNNVLLDVNRRFPIICKWGRVKDDKNKTKQNEKKILRQIRFSNFAHLCRCEYLSTYRSMGDVIHAQVEISRTERGKNNIRTCARAPEIETRGARQHLGHSQPPTTSINLLCSVWAYKDK